MADINFTKSIETSVFLVYNSVYQG